MWHHDIITCRVQKALTTPLQWSIYTTELKVTSCHQDVRWRDWWYTTSTHMVGIPWIWMGVGCWIPFFFRPLRIAVEQIGVTLRNTTVEIAFNLLIYIWSSYYSDMQTAKSVRYYRWELGIYQFNLSPISKLTFKCLVTKKKAPKSNFKTPFLETYHIQNSHGSC